MAFQKREEYELIDSGNRLKLEKFGHYVLVRPSPQSVWAPSLPERDWNAAHAVFVRKSSSEAGWIINEHPPASWNISFGGLNFVLRLVESGNVGLFPEQKENWSWLEEMSRRADRRLKVLNLFAYTGGSSLAVAKGGAFVCHLDASRSVIQWASKNAELSGMDGHVIRWIADDADKFIHREARRGNHYDAIILDPPSFGRGTKGEVWKIEERLDQLLHKCSRILTPKPAFVLLSCHSPGFTPTVLADLVSGMMKDFNGMLTPHEMVLPHTSSSRILTCGYCVRWTCGEEPE